MSAQASGAPGSGGVPHIYLKIAEIKGEARAKNHENEIELTSWSWGETQSVFPSETRKAGGSVSMRDFQLTAVTFCASAQFLLHCAAAKRLKTAIIICEQDQGGNKHVYLTITLSNVVIGSYDIEGSASQNHATDRLTLKFTKIEFNYTPMKSEGNPGGNYSCSWDLALNTS
jgi:type VI secretion system secreted protein Hcp